MFSIFEQARILDVEFCEKHDFFTETEKSRSVAIIQSRTQEPRVIFHNTLSDGLQLQQFERHKQQKRPGCSVESAWKVAQNSTLPRKSAQQ